MLPESFRFFTIVLRLFVASYFVLSGASKLFHGRTAVTRSIASYASVPQQLSKVLGIGLPPAEAILGIALLTGPAVRVAAVAIVVLLALFSGIVGADLIHEQKHACGCLGDFIVREISWGVVAQNLILAGAALCITIGPHAGIDSPVWHSLRQFGFAGIPTGLAGIGLTLLLLLWTYAEAATNTFKTNKASTPDHNVLNLSPAPDNRASIMTDSRQGEAQ